MAKKETPSVAMLVFKEGGELRTPVSLVLTEGRTIDIAPGERAEVPTPIAVQMVRDYPQSFEIETAGESKAVDPEASPDYVNRMMTPPDFNK